MSGSLAQKILRGDKRAAAQLITLLERRDSDAAKEMKQLLPHTGRAHRVGVTGAQGVGKSSLIDQLLPLALKRNKKVGVIAVDPTSPVTGGAFLGDRIRMQRHAAHPGVFIRSMAARGARGGLSPALHDAIRVLDALGCDPIFVETVGVGQDEVEIAQATDTTLLILTPASGDKIQALKAGLLEACDLLVLNKSDLPGSQAMAAALQGWVPTPLSQVSAAKGTGIPALFIAIEQHWREANRDGTAPLRRQQSLRAEIAQKAEERLLRALNDALQTKPVAALVEKLSQGHHSPDDAAKLILKKAQIKP